MSEFVLDVSTDNWNLWKNCQIKDGKILGEPEIIKRHLLPALLKILQDAPCDCTKVVISGVCPQWVNSLISLHVGRCFRDPIRVFRTNRKGKEILLV